MIRQLLFEISLTEMPHFERLVQMLEETETYARTQDDYALLCSSMTPERT